MLASVLGTLLVSQAFASPEALVPRNLMAKNPLLPEHWDSVRIAPHKEGRALLSSGEPTGYLMASLNFGSTDCSSNLGYYNTATGVCFVGSASNGTDVGSIVYTFSSVDNVAIYYASSQFSSPDCTGTPTTVAQAVPTACSNPEGSSDSFRYSYTKDADVADKFGPGLLFSYYANPAECSSMTPSGLYGWYGLGKCIPSDDGAFIFTQCADGQFTMAAFSDAKCQNFVSAAAAPLQKCNANTDADDDSELKPSKKLESFFCTGSQ